MRKLLFFVVLLPLMVLLSSCEKESDGYEGYYVRFMGDNLWKTGYTFYRVYYLDGYGSGKYYWYVTDRSGYYTSSGESKLQLSGDTYYYQKGTEKNMTYSVSGSTVTVVVPDEGVETFRISEVRHYSN